jgi:hypothetical protein
VIGRDAAPADDRSTEEMPERAAKPAASKPASSRKPSTRRRQPDRDEIATRAYFLHLAAGGGDQLGSWLPAERELMTA